MNKKKIHKDKNGHEFIKESYFVGGKMKFRRIYAIDGIPAEEFYEKNATDLDFYMDGDYYLMSSENESNNQDDEQIRGKFDSPDNVGDKDLPF